MIVICIITILLICLWAVNDVIKMIKYENHEMNYINLIKAIENQYYQGLDIYDKISIDKHITFNIEHYNNFFIYEAKLVNTMIDNICVNTYTFERIDGYMQLTHKEIFHKISNEVIDTINNWSKNIVETQRQKMLKEIEHINKVDVKIKEEELSRKEKEEVKLQKIFEEYKNNKGE